MAGDFTGDGQLDLAVANDGRTTVSVLLGNGDGTFQPAVDYAVGSIPIAIVAGDFNGDGHLDLAVVNADFGTTAHVSVLLGNGDGTFQPQVSYAVGRGPARIVAGDFTGDGHLDLAVATRRPTTSRCSWATATARSSPQVDLRGRDRTQRLIVAGTSAVTGTSTWRSPTQLGRHGRGSSRCCWATATARSSPRSTTRSGSVPDCYRGGRLHRRRPARPGRRQRSRDQRHVSVLLGNGDGTFQPQVTYAVGSVQGALVAGDFTGDGQLDLAVDCAQRRRVGAAGQRRRHVPAPGHLRRGGHDPDAIVAGDFNGDGRLDLAVATAARLTQSTGALLGNGDGTFQSQSSHRTRWGRTQAASWRATSPATASSTSPSRTQRSTRCLGAAGQRRRHVPARRSPTRSGAVPRRHRGG